MTVRQWTPAEEQRIRELRAEAALLSLTLNTNEFWEVAADAIRFQAEAARRGKQSR